MITAEKASVFHHFPIISYIIQAISVYQFAQSNSGNENIKAKVQQRYLSLSAITGQTK